MRNVEVGSGFALSVAFVVYSWCWFQVLGTFWSAFSNH